MKKSMLVVGLAALTLGACAHMRSDRHMQPRGLDPQLCNAPGHHCRAVTVSNGVIAPIGDVVVRSPNNQIYWEITTPGYSFPAATGIQFKDPAIVPRNEFTCNAIGRTVFHCVDRNTTRGRYEYKVTVTDGSRETVLDPSILND